MRQLFIYATLLTKVDGNLTQTTVQSGWRFKENEDEAVGSVTSHLLKEWPNWSISNFSIGPIPEEQLRFIIKEWDEEAAHASI